MDYLIYGIILITYFILCFTIAKKKSSNTHEFICGFVFMFFIPIVGCIIFWMINKKEGQVPLENIEHIFHGENESDLMFLSPINKEDELNKVSIEEALNINDYDLRRKMIVATMQNDDITEYLGVLKQALLNDDIETVHYASAVIMEAQKKINEMVISVKRRYKENPEEMSNIEAFEMALEKIIFSGAYDDRNLIKYYEEYKQLSNELLKKENLDEKYYYNRIKIDYKIGDLAHAEKLCKRYRKEYPKSENMIISNLKYCVLTNNKEMMDEFIGSIGDCLQNLSYEAMQYIKFYQ